jgi:hypothetical protein
MANPNMPSDPPPALSAAELRRRLLSSTPPPLAASAADPAVGEQVMAEIGAVPSASPNDLLSRLRMPGKSGPVRIPEPVPDLPSVPPSARSNVNRRTPPPSMGNALTAAIAGLDNLPRGDESPLAEIQRLRGENKELRTLLGEMKQLLQEASDTEQQLTAKQKESEASLTEKDSQIEELNDQLLAIEEKIEKGELAPPPPVPKTKGELEEWEDDLEKEASKLAQDRKKIDDERRQLREDEEGLETQMREMEVSMARERALIARQETELKRLSAEIQHELDLLQRGDAGLREQMAKFQRRAQEVMARPGANGSNPNIRR